MKRGLALLWGILALLAAMPGGAQSSEADGQPALAASGYVLVTAQTQMGWLALPDGEDVVYPLTQLLPDGTEALNLIHLTPEGVYVEDASDHLLILHPKERDIAAPQLPAHADHIVVETCSPVLQEDVFPLCSQALQRRDQMVSEALCQGRHRDGNSEVLDLFLARNRVNHSGEKACQCLCAEPSAPHCSLPGFRRYTHQTVLPFSGQGQCLGFRQRTVVPGNLSTIRRHLYSDQYPFFVFHVFPSLQQCEQLLRKSIQLPVFLQFLPERGLVPFFQVPCHLIHSSVTAHLQFFRNRAGLQDTV